MSEPRADYVEEIVDGRKVVIEFKSSSSRDGREGYRVVVSDAAGQSEVHEALVLAREARLMCLAALDPESGDYAQLRDAIREITCNCPVREIITGAEDILERTS